MCRQFDIQISSIYRFSFAFFSSSLSLEVSTFVCHKLFHFCWFYIKLNFHKLFASGEIEMYQITICNHQIYSISFGFHRFYLYLIYIYSFFFSFHFFLLCWSHGNFTLEFVLIKIEIFEWAKINRIIALMFIICFFFLRLFVRRNFYGPNWIISYII